MYWKVFKKYGHLSDEEVKQKVISFTHCIPNFY